MNAPFLTWLENCALRFLISSPRVGLVIVKNHTGSGIYVASDQSDPTLPGQFRQEEQPEPLSMQLERMYHEPAYGELE
jgi:hypothetical protein